jgi:thiol:disulfide interchange protein DsbD
VYTLGILVSFWAIVVVLLALRAGGSHLGWGFQFQSPGFIAAMAALLFFLGLSLAGQFDVGLSLTSAGGGLAQRSGYAGSFFTGVLATIVATPCTGPFMGAAIGYALAQPAYVTLVIFTALALGLALPYLLLTMRPAWTKLLPKPGVWMEYLKLATAVPIFATVIWLVWLYTVLAGTDALIPLLACFVLLAVAGWVLGRWPAKAAGSVAALVLAVIALALPLSATRRSHVEAKTTVAADSAWQPYSAAAFAAARSQGKPVFIDFTAQWCLSCQVNERVALGRPDIQARFAKEGVVLFRADWTQQDPEVTSALEALGRNGVPVYALYAANSQQPRLLPEVLTPGIVLDALTDLQQRTQAAKGVPQ